MLTYSVCCRECSNLAQCDSLWQDLYGKVVNVYVPHMQSVSDSQPRLHSPTLSAARWPMVSSSALRPESHSAHLDDSNGTLGLSFSLSQASVDCGTSSTYCPQTSYLSVYPSSALCDSSGSSVCPFPSPRPGARGLAHPGAPIVTHPLMSSSTVSPTDDDLVRHRIVEASVSATGACIVPSETSDVSSLSFPLESSDNRQLQARIDLAVRPSYAVALPSQTPLPNSLTTSPAELSGGPDRCTDASSRADRHPDDDHQGHMHGPAAALSLSRTALVRASTEEIAVLHQHSVRTRALDADESPPVFASCSPPLSAAVCSDAVFVPQHPSCAYDGNRFISSASAPSVSAASLLPLSSRPRACPPFDQFWTRSYRRRMKCLQWGRRLQSRTPDLVLEGHEGMRLACSCPAL